MNIKLNTEILEVEENKSIIELFNKEIGENKKKDTKVTHINSKYAKTTTTPLHDGHRIKDKRTYTTNNTDLYSTTNSQLRNGQ